MRVSVDSLFRNTNMWYVEGAVAVLKLLFSVGLPQQHLLCCNGFVRVGCFFGVVWKVLFFGLDL